MATTKDYYEKLMENQNKLFGSITDYANEIVDITMPDSKVVEKTEAFFKECMNASFEYTEDLSKKENIEKFQEDFWGTMTDNYNKGIKLSADLYKKTMEYVRDIWSGNQMNNQQEKVQHLTEFYQNYWKTYMDVTKENTEVVQEFLNESAKAN